MSGQNPRGLRRRKPIGRVRAGSGAVDAEAVLHDAAARVRRTGSAPRGRRGGTAQSGGLAHVAGRGTPGPGPQPDRARRLRGRASSAGRSPSVSCDRSLRPAGRTPSARRTRRTGAVDCSSRRPGRTPVEIAGRRRVEGCGGSVLASTSTRPSRPFPSGVARRRRCCTRRRCPRRADHEQHDEPTPRHGPRRVARICGGRSARSCAHGARSARVSGPVEVVVGRVGHVSWSPTSRGAATRGGRVAAVGIEALDVVRHAQRPGRRPRRPRCKRSQGTEPAPPSGVNAGRAS